MKYLTLFIISIISLIWKSASSSIISNDIDSSGQKIDDIMSELWKVGHRYHYSTTSAIRETECDYLKERLNEIQDYFNRKFPSNQLIKSSVEILVNGMESYQKEKVCHILDNPDQNEIILAQNQEINFGLNATHKIRKNFARALVITNQANSTKAYLSHILCLTKLWAKETVAMTSTFLKTQLRIKRLFSLTIEKIIKLFEFFGYKPAEKCEFNEKIGLDNNVKYPKSIEFMLINTLAKLMASLDVKND